MHDIAGSQIDTPRRIQATRRGLVLALAGLLAAAGLVAAGRFTAPSAKTVAASTAPAACGTAAPSVMPSPGCAHVLESAFGAGSVQSADFAATMAPTTTPPRYAQRVLEAICGGVPLNANRP